MPKRDIANIIIKTYLSDTRKERFCWSI